MKRLAGWLLAGLSIAQAAQAQVPERINYQGRFADGGALLSGAHAVAFRLCAQPEAGQVLYAETQTVAVVDGYFSAHIGASNAVPGSLFAALTNAAVYLEVQVGSTVLSPRERLVAVPMAAVAAAVVPDAIRGATIADGSVGAADLTDGAALAEILNDDGAGSNLDADRLDGVDSTGFVRIYGAAGGGLAGTYPNPTIAAGAVNSTAILDGSVSATDLANGTALAEILDNDGAGSNLDADLLDGFSSAAFMRGGDAAGGALLGTYPNPTIAAGAVNATHILDGSVGASELAAGAVNSTAIANGSVAAVDLADGAALAEILNNDGTGSNLDADLLDGFSSAAFVRGGDAAGGGLAGAYPNPTIAAGAVNSTAILDGSVSATDLANGTALAEILDNDGAGSNLDADKLDALSSASFLRSDVGASFSGGTLTLASGSRLDTVGGLYIGGTGTADNDTIYFDNGSVWLKWLDGSTLFSFSDDLNLSGRLIVGDQTSPPACNAMRPVPAGWGLLPTSGAMDKTADLYIQEDLEVGSSAFLSGALYMQGTTASVANVTQSIFFYHNNSRVAESIKWDKTSERFAISDDLEIAGEAYKPGGGSWSVSSDARIKTDVQLLVGALDRLDQTQPVSFLYKPEAQACGIPGRNIGFIAQELEEVFPQWVDTDENGMKSVTFRGFEAVSVQAIKELREENRALRERLLRLEEKIGTLAATP